MSSPCDGVEVFIAYAEEDTKREKELGKRLGVLKREGLVRCWQYRKILVGDEWDREIHEHLNTADIFLLLISADFVDSDYCWEVEMKRAMERHDAGEAIVIPVILRATPDWKRTLFGKLQGTPGNEPEHPDREGVYDWSNEDQALKKVAEDVRACVENFVEKRAQAASLGREVIVVRPKDIVLDRRDASTGSPWKYPGSYSGQIVAGPDDLEMVWVEPGEFQMGASWERADNNEKPVHPVHITGGFWLGRCVVTNAKFAKFLNDINRSMTPDGKVLSSRDRIMLDTGYAEVDLVGNTWFGVQVGREKHPAAGVTPYGADAYAAHYGLQLPTDAQWEYAARGESNWRYPWGNQWDKEKCCNKYNQPPDGRNRFPVDSFPEGESWCKALNMVGNVWECCADWFDAEYYMVSPEDDPPGPPDTGMRVVRGGSFFYDEDSCTTTSHHGTPPENTTDSLGFRCAYTPDAESGEVK